MPTARPKPKPKTNIVTPAPRKLVTPAKKTLATPEKVSSPKSLLPRPIYYVLYGPPGVGKTSLVAQAPNVGFIIDPQEEGILNLVDYGRVKEPTFIETADTFERLCVLLEQVADGKFGNLELLAIDSLTGMEKLCFIHHCTENFENDWTAKGFYAFQAGPRNAAKTDWPALIDAFNLVTAAGISIAVIAHSEVKPFNNPEGPDYDRFQPYLHKDIWQITSRWAQATFFYNYSVEIEKKGLRSKARDVEDRFIQTVWTPTADAKNCYGLDPLIKADTAEEGYANLMKNIYKCVGKI